MTHPRIPFASVLPIDQIARHVSAWRQSLNRKARTIIGVLDVRMEMLITAWILVMFAFGAVKVLTAPMVPGSLAGKLALMLPYLLVALAPVAGYRVAAGSFPRGMLSAQPIFRLARIGRWRDLDVVDARANPAYGPAGFMASLLVGILLNVPVRTAEYLVAIPAVGGDAPIWALVLFHAMTFDVIVMSFFYMVCFVMALRSVPLFPRMMAFAWVFDAFMQFAIAHQVARVDGLPPEVASALLSVLHGNLQKVLISAALWLPYLLLSERVNVTYRLRCSSRGN